MTARKSLIFGTVIASLIAVVACGTDVITAPAESVNIVATATSIPAEPRTTSTSAAVATAVPSATPPVQVPASAPATTSDVTVVAPIKSTHTPIQPVTGLTPTPFPVVPPPSVPPPVPATPPSASLAVPTATLVPVPTPTISQTPTLTPEPQLSTLDCVLAGIAELGILYSQPPPPGGWTGPEPTPSLYTTECDLELDPFAPVPQIVTSHYVPLAQVQQVSRFRSGAGHSFTDDFETCSSMKHYFRFFPSLDWTQVPVFSPFDGVIAMLSPETLETGAPAGHQIWVVSRQNPAYVVLIFHADPLPGLRVGDVVGSGEQIAKHTGNHTWSDISFEAITTGGMRNMSYLAAMPPELFDDFQARGASSIDDFIYTPEYRAQNPIQCSGESFVSPPGILGDPANFFVLN